MEKGIKIRKFRREDAAEVCNLVRETFLKFVAPSFSKKGVRKYLASLTPETFVGMAKGSLKYVAVEEGKIVGVVFGNYKNGSIGLLFVRKDMVRKGIGRLLLNKIEKEMKKKGVKAIKLNASLYAVPFYEKMGYKKSRCVVKKDGQIHQPMIKKFK